MEHRACLGDLEVRGGHGQVAVVRDADFHLGAAVVAEEAGARRAVGAGKDFDLAPGEADSRAVEAFEHRFFGGPPAGEALVVPRAVGDLGWRVDLGQEAGAGAADGEGDPVDGDRVDADPLHRIILPRYSTVTDFARFRGWSTS